MTSGQFHTVPVDFIHVEREGRQRREITDIESLADSIRRLGLIHPLVVERDGRLVAGERRYTALKALGWDAIPVQYTDEIDDATRRAIELEENIKRKDIPWRDEVEAIASFHADRVAADPSWTQAQTADAIGVTQASVNQKLAVADQLRRGNKLVTEADRFSKALNVTSRTNERAKASTAQAIFAAAQAPASQAAKPVIVADFHEWQERYTGPKFNLIHCDFPYGIGMDKSDQGGGGSHGYYEDSLDTYTDLLIRLDSAMDNVIDESAHLVFWFSMKYYVDTLEALRGMGWKVDDFPLVWHRSDNAGIIPDSNRGPRRTYETAFFGSRGDRKIVRGVANSFGYPTVRDRHMSEKPQPVIEHFFRMLVDEHTSLFDPTCGSASAIRAGKALGATRMLGLED